jgi:hypothetical protein
VARPPRHSEWATFVLPARHAVRVRGWPVILWCVQQFRIS